MAWLDDLISKGQQAVKANCDPPWTVDYDWPLKKQPPSIISTAPPDAPEMVSLYIAENPLTLPCKGWYTREYIHTSPATGQTISVAKWWNSNTSTTQWTVAAGGLGLIETKFPELYGLLAPLPENAKISDDIDDPEFPSIDKGELAEYVEKIGTKDPDVPTEVKKAGFPWWMALLGLVVVGGVIYSARKRKKKKKGSKKLKKYRPAWELP